MAYILGCSRSMGREGLITWNATSKRWKYRWIASVTVWTCWRIDFWLHLLFHTLLTRRWVIKSPISKISHRQIRSRAIQGWITITNFLQIPRNFILTFQVFFRRWSERIILRNRYMIGMRGIHINGDGYTTIVTGIWYIWHIQLGVAFIEGSIVIGFLNDRGSIWVAIAGFRGNFNVRNSVYWICL